MMSVLDQEGTQLDWRWSTHQPLIETVLSVLEPDLIVELGGGIFSTPVFIAHDPDRFICIENDKEWYEELIKEVGSSEKLEIRLHDLGEGIDKGTFKKKLSNKQKAQIESYYLKLGKEVQAIQAGIKFLFVDNFICCRSIALNVLSKSFDILAYHDCEPAGIRWYEYYFSNHLKKKFHHYYLQTPDSWTGLFIANNREWDLGLLEEESKKFCKEYAERNKIDKVFLKRTR